VAVVVSRSPLEARTGSSAGCASLNFRVEVEQDSFDTNHSLVGDGAQHDTVLNGVHSGRSFILLAVPAIAGSAFIVDIFISEVSLIKETKIKLVVCLSVFTIISHKFIESFPSSICMTIRGIEPVVAVREFICILSFIGLTGETDVVHLDWVTSGAIFSTSVLLHRVEVPDCRAKLWKSSFLHTVRSEFRQI